MYAFVNGNVIYDCFANAEREVIVDKKQDYHLEYASENRTHTVVVFSRKLDTCDTQDKAITESTVRVIWAFHSEDVGETFLQYHGQNRGRKSVRLLHPGKSTPIDKNTLYFDIRNRNVSVPEKDTTYWCEMFKFPVLDAKHHIIKFEPVIQPGHENLVHHILLYQCDSSQNDSVLQNGHECYHPNMPDAFYLCDVVISAWAIGGEGFTYPPHVGFSIGTTGDPIYVLLETHYDNPTYKEGLTDSSGLRLFYTPELRTYDAGIIETGVWVSLYHMIPPHVPAFVSEGHCPSECVTEVLNEEMPSGINVFGVFLHAHLAGRVLRTRHIRKGVEQEILAYDDEFDFNYQEAHLLKEERVLLPGDSLITECHYDTSDRTHMTWGGISTRDEMCLSYLLYYPKIKFARCQSIPEIIEQLNFIGVEEIYLPVLTWPFTIKSPEEYNNLTFTDAMDTFGWDRNNATRFNKFVLTVPINIRCTKGGEENWENHGILLDAPEINRPFKHPSLECSARSLCSSFFLMAACIINALV
ncbi:DBH-like monooxygenase protein 1 [Protopterus annectens]|uniref:DBH-like monooxygenase protein 1 n=1 Tax=Protopterus annectens TaxID=7888 RepID=UPI001CFBDD4E|nr:DBH-like monooxygenase protein 1 [Protopterus annectens]